MVIRECKHCTAPLPEDSDICIYCATENIIAQEEGQVYMDKSAFETMVIEAIETFSTHVVEIGNAYEELTKQITENTRLLEESALNYQDSRKNSAQNLNNFAARIEEIAPQFRTLQGAIRESLTGYINELKREGTLEHQQLFDVRTSVDGLLEKVQGAVDSNTSFYNSVEPDLQTNDSYNLALFRTKNAIGRILYQFRIYQKFLATVRDDIDNYLTN